MAGIWAGAPILVGIRINLDDFPDAQLGPTYSNGCLVHSIGTNCTIANTRKQLAVPCR